MRVLRIQRLFFFSAVGFADVSDGHSSGKLERLSNAMLLKDLHHILEIIRIRLN